ncbi:hypothetical protein [Streptomyces sp. NPDC055140]
MALLKRLHMLPMPDLPLSRLDPLVRVSERIDVSVTLLEDNPAMTARPA